MKAQKLGLVLGMNMAVACMMLQGCKATRPGAGNDYPPPAVDPVVTTTEPVPVDPVPVPATTTATVTTIPSAPEPQPVVVEPQPTTVTKVKPLPPPTVKPVVKPVEPVASVDEAGFVYVVKKGDQLASVSRRYNVKLSAIERANPGLNRDKIRIGQKIKIPGVTEAAAGVAKPANDVKAVEAAAATPAPVAANTTAPVKTTRAFKSYTGATKEYKVRNGDSLGKIAHESGITIRALKELNKMTKDSLRIGQTILIPATKVVAETPAKAADVKPAVKPADKASDAKVVENAAKPVEKKDAAPAVAPVAPAAPTAPAAPAATPAVAPVAPAADPVSTEAPVVEETKDAAPAPAAGPTYTVKEGDDLVSVAIAWGISPSQLMDLNDLKAGDGIKPGQTLKLPANAKQQSAQ